MGELCIVSKSQITELEKAVQAVEKGKPLTDIELRTKKVFSSIRAVYEAQRKVQAISNKLNLGSEKVIEARKELADIDLS